jgi:Skp family chaperone for outer membrane proteins
MVKRFRACSTACAVVLLISSIADTQSEDISSLIDAVEMKRSVSLGSTSGLDGEASASNLRIGFVDMNRLFTSHPKTKSAESQLNRERSAAKEELDERLEKLNSLTRRMQQSSGSEKDRLASEARALDIAITEFRESREQVLQEKFVDMRKEIIDAITSVVIEVAEEQKLNVLLDRSGMSMGQVPVVVYTKNVFDLTDTCIAKF